MAYYPIRVAARKTGLTTATLRAWERRYGAVAPDRTDSGQRSYSEEDVRRLRLLRDLVDGGRAISQVSDLSNPELEDLLRHDSPPGVDAQTRRRFNGGPDPILSEALGAVRALDPTGLERVLRRGCLDVGPIDFVDRVLVPLLVSMGEEWREGSLGPASEHLASGVIRRILDWLLTTLAPPDQGPLLVLATPAGQVHEFGALLAGVVAAGAGWRVAYLGPDLPSGEIVRGAVGLGAQAVALSVLRPKEEPGIFGEIEAIRSGLPGSVSLFVGGPVLGQVTGMEGVDAFHSLEEFRGRIAR